MSLKKAANMLLAQAEADEAMHETTKQIDCRPLDGAFAFDAVLKDLYGMTAIGKEIRSMFGGQLPELKTLPISPTEEVQVPFGLLEFPPLGAQFYLQERWDDDFGHSFQIYVMAKKRYSQQIRGLLMLVEAYIKEHGVYRGKAMVGVGHVKSNVYKGPRSFVSRRKRSRYSQMMRESRSRSTRRPTTSSGTQRVRSTRSSIRVRTSGTRCCCMVRTELARPSLVPSPRSTAWSMDGPSSRLAGTTT
jgi:hypothetical protein